MPKIVFFPIDAASWRSEDCALGALASDNGVYLTLQDSFCNSGFSCRSVANRHCRSEWRKNATLKDVVGRSARSGNQIQKYMGRRLTGEIRGAPELLRKQRDY